MPGPAWGCKPFHHKEYPTLCIHPPRLPGFLFFSSFLLLTNHTQHHLPSDRSSEMQSPNLEPSEPSATNLSTPAMFKLPVELWEMIIAKLKRDSHCSLRLVCKHLSYNCSGRSFQKAVQCQIVNLNDEGSMARFGTLSANQYWGKYVQDVSFIFSTCPPSDAKKRPQSPKNTETLFNKLVGCFKSSSNIESLHIRGEGGGCDHDEWEHPELTYDETSAAYLIVFSAAMKAGLICPYP